MKSLILAIIIAFAITVGGISHSRFIDKISNKMIVENEKVTELIENGEIKRSYEYASRLTQILEKNRIILAATVNHQQLAEIELLCRELLSYISYNKESDALAKSYSLSVCINNLNEENKITLENIL